MNAKLNKHPSEIAFGASDRIAPVLQVKEIPSRELKNLTAEQSFGAQITSNQTPFVSKGKS